MNILSRLRLFHDGQAILAMGAYASGEAGIIHSLLGYGVAALILIRFIWAAGGAPQLGLSKFYPQFEGLKLGNALTHPAISLMLLAAIAICLIGVTVTGIMMDKGRALDYRPATSLQVTAQGHQIVAGGEEEGTVKRAHEALAHMLIAIVGLHIGYLLVCKRPLALFMLFLRAPKRPPGQ